MSNGKPSELAGLTDGRATAVYWCPATQERLPHLLIAAPGPKPFIRVWLDDLTATGNGNGKVADWTWHKPNDATRIDEWIPPGGVGTCGNQLADPCGWSKPGNCGVHGDDDHRRAHNAPIA